MGRPWSKIGIGALVAVVAVAGAIWAMRSFAPGMLDQRPKIVETPPLAPVSRSSMIVTPAVITLSAIRNALEKVAPPELTGKLPALPMLPNAEIGWSVTRSAFDVTGRSDGVWLYSALRGSMNATGIELPRGLPGPPGGFSGPPGFPGPPGGFRAPLLAVRSPPPLRPPFPPLLAAAKPRLPTIHRDRARFVSLLNAATAAEPPRFFWAWARNTRRTGVPSKP